MPKTDNDFANIIIREGSERFESKVRVCPLAVDFRSGRDFRESVKVGYMDRYFYLGPKHALC